jgi:hypothetical protein
MKRTKDKIRGAQCPDCGEYMEKQKRIVHERIGGRWSAITTEIIWKCTNKRCIKK